MIGINDSYTCIYPMIKKEFKLSLSENVVDTFIYHTTYDDCFSISYEFKENKGTLQAGLFEFNHRKFEQSKLLLDIISSEDTTKVAYTIKRPEILKNAFSLFEEGRYIEFDKRLKYSIVNYINTLSNRHEGKQDEITAILFNDPTYREFLSKKLGYEIPDEYLLGSMPIIANEMFDPEFITEIIDTSIILYGK